MDPNGLSGRLGGLAQPEPAVARVNRAANDEPGSAARSGATGQPDPCGGADARPRPPRSTGPSPRIPPAPRSGSIHGQAAGHRPGGVRESRP